MFRLWGIFLFIQSLLIFFRYIIGINYERNLCFGVKNFFGLPPHLLLFMVHFLFLWGKCDFSMEHFFIYYGAFSNFYGAFLKLYIRKHLLPLTKG